MKSSEIKTLFDQFEKASFEYEGIECWSARELYESLEIGRASCRERV